MILDFQRETRLTWGVLAAIFALVVIALIVTWESGSSLDSDLAQVRAAHDQRTGPEDLARRVERQRAANKQLKASIEALKHRVGFTLQPAFSIPPNTNDLGDLWSTRFTAVREALQNKAGLRGRSIGDYDAYLGFPNDGRVPPSSEVPQRLTQLQIVDKAVGIALATPNALQRIRVHLLDPVKTGPPGAPPLIEEFPIELTVSGSLEDILWILHRISQVDPVGGPGSDYPLILCALTIDSKNAKPIDDIQQLDAVFVVAGMRFLSDAERQHQAGHGAIFVPPPPAPTVTAQPTAPGGHIPGGPVPGHPTLHYARP